MQEATLQEATLQEATLQEAGIDLSTGIRLRPPISQLGAVNFVLRSCRAPKGTIVSREVESAIATAAANREQWNGGSVVFIDSPVIDQGKLTTSLVAVVDGERARIFFDVRRPS